MKTEFLSAEERTLFPSYKLIENGKEAIFIHIPKTAGTSIRHTFGFPKPARSNLRFKKHYDLKQVEGYLGPECVRNSYVFTFVRNPWDRLFSAFLFRRRAFLQGRLKPLAGEEKCLSDFEFWIRFMSKFNRIDNCVVTKSQLSWITNIECQVQCDYLGRFEHLSEDYKKICQLLEIESKPLLKRNVSIRQRQYQASFND